MLFAVTGAGYSSVQKVLPCCGPEVPLCCHESSRPLAGQTVLLLYVCSLTKLFIESHYASTGNVRKHLCDDFLSLCEQE